jgi:hypothetical protein
VGGTSDGAAQGGGGGGPARGLAGMEALSALGRPDPASLDLEKFPAAVVKELEAVGVERRRRRLMGWRRRARSGRVNGPCLVLVIE